MNAEKKTLQL